MTLIEITIALAIAAMMVGVAVVSTQALTHTDLRNSAIGLAGAVKSNYDRAIMEKRIQRIGMDLDQHVWWVEYTEDPFALSQERLRGDEGLKRDEEGNLKKDDDDDSFFFDDDDDEEVKRALEGGKAAAFKPDEAAGEPFALPGDVQFVKVHAGHQEEAAVFEEDFGFQDFVLAVAEVEMPFSAQADGGNNGVVAQFGLVVAVPAHAVAAVAVKVEQDAVVAGGGGLLNGCPNRREGRCPGFRLHADVGVGIDGAGVAMPCDEAGNGMFLAEKLDSVLAPGGIFADFVEVIVRYFPAEKCGEIADICLLKGNFLERPRHVAKIGRIFILLSDLLPARNILCHAYRCKS